jgi:hypothetical protein
MAGPGVLRLLSGNTLSGGITIESGNLSYQSQTAFGSGTIRLAGGIRVQRSGTEGNTSSVGTNNNVVLTGGQVEMNVDWSGINDQWYNGIISGEGRIRITGGGSDFTRGVGLSGNNTYTGATTISQGVLNIQHAGALGTTAGGTSVGSGAVLGMRDESQRPMAASTDTEDFTKEACLIQGERERGGF